MKKSFFLKCAMLAALMVATFFVARVVVGQAKGGSTTARERLRGSARIVSAAEGRAAAAAARANAVALPYAALTWGGLDVQTIGHNVNVTAKAEIYETDPTLNYTWVVRLWDSGSPVTKKLLNEQIYAHQRFALPDGENTLSPTFSENLTLAPGTYRVEVLLLSFPANTDLAAVKPGVNPPFSSRVAGNQEIVIAD
jgi:hypothetical protein